MNRHTQIFLLFWGGIWLFSPLYAQPFELCMELGKAEFLKERNFQDYQKARNYFEKAIAQQPKDAEAHYFMGYALSRLYAADATAIPSLKRPHTQEVSEYFEKVIRLSPKYEGEMVSLDPYSKIIAEWSSLALFYLQNAKADSAIWALKEGKKRSGLYEPWIEYAKNLLNNCEKNAILFSSGDMNFFPLFYAQLVENIRPDVVVIDIGLVNAPWYVEMFRSVYPQLLSLSGEDLAAMDFVPWEEEPFIIPIKSERFSEESTFAWLVPPVYQQYIFRGHRVMLDILLQNGFERPVYFTKRIPDEETLGLYNYFEDEGIVYKITPKKENLFSQDYLTRIQESRLVSLEEPTIAHSTDLIAHINVVYRYAYMNYILKGEETLAKSQRRLLFKEMQSRIPESHIPYLGEFMPYIEEMEKQYK